MTQITYDEFIQQLLAVNCAQHGEFLPNNYCRYKNDHISGAVSSLFYYTDGFAVYYSASDFGVFVNIHQVSDDMSLSRVVAEFTKRINEYAADSAVKSKYMVKPDAGKEYDNLVTKYHYSRISEKYQPDAHIAQIPIDNAGEIISMCEPYLENDTSFGKMLACSFSADYNGYESKLIGHYDGCLVGVASYDYCDAAALGTLNNIFVIPERRGCGVGSALVRAAMSEYPEKRWLYQADNGNNISQQLAASLGYSLAGKAIMFNI